MGTALDHLDSGPKRRTAPRRAHTVWSGRDEAAATANVYSRHVRSTGTPQVLTREEELGLASQLCSNRKAFEILVERLPDPVRNEVLAPKASGRGRSSGQSIGEVEAKYRRMVALAAEGAGPIPRQTLDEAERLVSEILRARDILILSNTGFVIRSAQQFAGRRMPLEDLVQEGMAGLLRAVDTYDPERGRVTTYAKFWIERSIQRALLNQPNTIRRPVHVGRKIAALLNSSHDLEAELGRQPSSDELARTLGVAVRSIDELRSISKDPIALETIDGIDGTSGPLAHVADPNAEDPLGAMAEQERTRALAVAMEQLDPRERKIIGRRFGMDGGGAPWSLQQIGELLGLSRERTRQIESFALRKLRKVLCPDAARRGKGMRQVAQQG